MSDKKPPVGNLLDSLRERAKEFDCLYEIEEMLKDFDRPLEDVCADIIEEIPSGWQFPDVCVAKISMDGKDYSSPDFVETSWVLSAQIQSQEKVFGSINVYYTREMPQSGIGPFLSGEKRLIDTIADRFSHYIQHRKWKKIVRQWETAQDDLSRHRKPEWQVVLELLRRTDKNLLLNVSHKMLNHLCWNGIEEAEQLRQGASIGPITDDEEMFQDVNQPHAKQALLFSEELSVETFRIASEHFADEDILNRMQRWIQQEKLVFLVQVVNRNLPLSEVADAIRRYHHLAAEEKGIESPNKKGIEVSLIRRFFSDQLDFIKVAKNYIEVSDFYRLLKRVVYATESHGKLGGKSAGVYLASQILKKSEKHPDLLGNVKTPRTWYVSSDMLLQFMRYNNFDEVVEQKYKDIDQVRLEYPYIVRTFKNSHFPMEIVQGLSLALDDFGDCPLIVRSSSLLEDRLGASFSGKYKSLFIANRGTKAEKLEALTDAIAEVYASTFGPDPIEYRAERGLLDFGEEMGIMIQEVVGSRIGKYFFPTFAGVAFSRNEFRWSPRIKREDGLIRMVPGLGTRAVDRLSSDYPILVAPGQPNLRVNVSINEIVQYSPKEIDVIDLDTNSLETLTLEKILREVGDEIPGVEHIVSTFDGDHVRRLSGLNTNFDEGKYVVTFDGLMSQTKFIEQVHAMLEVLESELGTPVDIEFASDGKDFYLLQCRPQCYAPDALPAPIPKDIPDEDVLFSANKYISNGTVEGITHIVYVDPIKYGQISEHSEMLAVGRAVGRLNKLLPKRQFILMGPGRWGSKGDIKLGVSVTYSDINNSVVLMEIARQKGDYLPDLSFGTHFFQDLVETNVRYLPLYPDDDGVVFNERFFTSSPNILLEVLPEYAHLSDVLRLIDVSKSSGGKVLRILMNADLDEAVGILAHPGGEEPTAKLLDQYEEQQPENHWSWRLRMAEKIASQMDPSKFGVIALYIFGSTKNGTAGPGSDIDILVHFRGTANERDMLNTWLHGWSLCLDEVNYLRTGYRTGGLLDVHIVTDADIEKKTSYAVKIGAVTDAARPLSLGKSE